MKSLIVAGALAAVLGTGLVTPGTAEAGDRHRHGRHGYSQKHSRHHRPHYRPSHRRHYRPYYRPYYRSYSRPYYYAPPAYTLTDPYYYDYGPGYCRRPAVGVGFYFGR